MAEIILKNVTADFPIYGNQVSFRNALFGRVVGGVLRRPTTPEIALSCGRSTTCRLPSTTVTSWEFSATTEPANRPCCGCLRGFISRARAR